MRPRWQLLVDGLGRIERAEVEVRPLLLLVGANNTGKSYLASLLWGLVAMQADLELPPGAAVQACDDWLRRIIKEGERSAKHELSPEEIGLFDRLFEATLEANRDRIVARIFNSQSVGAGRLQLRNVSEGRHARFEWTADEQTGTHVLAVHDGAGGEEKSISTSLHVDDLGTIRVAARDLLMRRLTFFRMTRLFKPFYDSFSSIDPVYLPASRTGFMQLYKGAVQRSLRDVFRRELGESSPLDLTTPAFHFIDMLALGLKEKRSQTFAEEAELLERALSGQVELIAGQGVNEFRYKPEGGGVSLPMSLSSSLVTELAPLVLVLRHLSSFPLLVLEEPEAHLHPALQRRLAQVIVRLVRKGLYVWITTHSENFCQQINNFLKIGMSPEREALQGELGYGPQDYLELDDVAGYGFQPEGPRSAINRLEASEQGLTMPTFNRELIALSKETLLLQRRGATKR
ncbi:AAA family ATPase [Sorangium sp. So ce204]|uniref:AAA family ATPase n=1 Tax=Sorangium sp. So ce204 TaxID=3133288 RepID=UPI003F600FD1